MGGYVSERVKYFKRYATDKLIIAKLKTGSNSVITCNRLTRLALCTISDGRLSMYQVSFDSLLYFQRHAPDKFNIAKIRKGNNSINTDTGLWFLHSARSLIALYHCVKFHLFIFNTFTDMLTTSLLLQKIGRKITCDRVTIPALCTSSDGHLSLYQVSFNSLLYFQRYAPDKLFIANIKKGSNSVNTGDRVMVLAFCNSPCSPLSVCQVSLSYLQCF